MPEPPEILVIDSVHVRFVELVATVSDTVEENPLTGDTLIVEVPVTPVLIVTVVGFAVIKKSGGATTSTVIVPEVPVLPL